MSSENVLFVFDDDMEEDFLRMMAEVNSYRLGEDLQRFEGQDTRDLQLSAEQGQRAHFVISQNSETGHEQRILMLAPRGESEDEL